MSNKSNCNLCQTKISKLDIGLNKKLLGEKNNRHYCINCLSNHLDVSLEELLSIAERYREQGCKLFS